MKVHDELIPAALYARVSSDRQDVDLSVSAQLRALRDYAQKNGYLVAREYVDEAESGRFANRPHFRQMLDEASKPDAPFREILVWKFSRFTRKREHAVAFKSMLRRRGIRVVSITEYADDTPTGKLMEAIIESVDEFYSENLGQEVTRGMREAASRGFWVAPNIPYGYRRAYIQDGGKKRPRLEPIPPADGVIRRIFEMALKGNSTLDITRTLNEEGISSPNGKKWLKTGVHRILTNETYTGTLIWGVNSKDKAPPVRVEGAFPAIVSEAEFRSVGEILRARSPSKVHPRRAASRYLLSGLTKCDDCNRALIGQEAKSGEYAYYVCHSLIKQGKGTCSTPRLNAKSFEELIVGQIRDHILTESNIRDLVRLVDEEMDGVAQEQRQKLQTIEQEIVEVRRRLDRIWHALETTDLDISDASSRIKGHREREEQLEVAAKEARAALLERRTFLDRVDTITEFAKDMSDFLKTSSLTECKAFVRTFVKEIRVNKRQATVAYTIPTPDDSRPDEEIVTAIGLGAPVLSTVLYGSAYGIRTRGLRLERAVS